MLEMKVYSTSTAFFVILAWVFFSFVYFLALHIPHKNKAPSMYERLDRLEHEVSFQINQSRNLRDSFNSAKKELEKANIEMKKTSTENGNPKHVIGVLVISCNRVSIKRCLDLLIKFRPSQRQFPIVVSQDCNHKATADVIRSYGDKVTHIMQPDQSDIKLTVKEKKFQGYYKISRHYKWALQQMFHKFNFNSIIIVEDDLDIAPDFFQYFQETYSILKVDSTLWCVSAWNDNGKVNIINNDEPELLYRTDFFPGLGWMLTKDLWLELEPKWPKSFWDDWMRIPAQRKDRSCIRPEISRTRTFGKVGVSKGLFFDKHLKYIKLNNKKVPFETLDLTYLLKNNYDVSFVKKVYDSQSAPNVEYIKNNKASLKSSVKIEYKTKEEYKRYSKAFGLMDDFKSGVPRTGYRGVVSFMYEHLRVYLAPPADWSGYNTAWS